MASLILLNGPPASGKSTLAQLFVDERPLSLNLDIDVVRALLGNWLGSPTEAGLAARSLALAMAETHLASERDVIVPQFLGRTDFIEQLETLAFRTGITFIEVALVLDRNAALAAFAERQKTPTSQSHRDASALVDHSSDSNPIEVMYDAYLALLEQRPEARRVEVIRDDIAATFNRLVEAIGSGKS